METLPSGLFLNHCFLFLSVGTALFSLVSLGSNTTLSLRLQNFDGAVSETNVEIVNLLLKDCRRESEGCVDSVSLPKVDATVDAL